MVIHGVRGGYLLADVLVPQFGTRRNKVAHQFLALTRIEIDDLDAARSEIVLPAPECGVLPHDHPRDAVEKDRPGAHVTR